MEKNNYLVIYIGIFGILLVLLGLNSCGKEVRGCRDVLAETYDAKATASDETLCVYAKDKFIGDYKGTFICPNALSTVFNNPDFSYSISETVAGNVNQVTLRLPVLGVPTNFAGRVEGSGLTVDQIFKDLPFTIPGGSTPIKVDLIAKGTLNLGSDKKTITGLINLDIKQAGNTLAVDNCPITGTKQ